MTHPATPDARLLALLLHDAMKNKKKGFGRESGLENSAAAAVAVQVHGAAVRPAAAARPISDFLTWPPTPTERPPRRTMSPRRRTQPRSRCRL